MVTIPILIASVHVYRRNKYCCAGILLLVPPAMYFFNLFRYFMHCPLSCDTQAISNVIPSQQPDDYIYDHLEVLFGVQTKFLPSPTYLTKHTEMDEEERNAMISWMIYKHDQSLQLLPKTFFLAVNILDRFLGITMHSFLLFFRRVVPLLFSPRYFCFLTIDLYR
jgi:hypothetical protein